MMLSAHADLVLRIDGTMVLNAQRIELLRQIANTNSLTAAAKKAGYSYKGAWDAVEAITQSTGNTLLTRIAGGKGGGRTVLTEAGARLIEDFDRMQQDHQRAIEVLNERTGFKPDVSQTVSPPLKTSIRNQLAGVITGLSQELATETIRIQLDSGIALASTITHESSRMLQLDLGSRVFALIKASSVKCAEKSAHAGDEPVNRVTGKICKLIEGLQSTEFRLLLPDDSVLVGTIANQNKPAFQLASGKTLTVTIAPSDVMLAVSS